MTADNDLKLLARTAEGDRMAFGAFVRIHRTAVFRFVCHLGADDASAEDVMQDTFIASLRNAGSFRGGGSARSWLFTIAANAYRQRNRLRAGEPRTFAPLDELGQQAGWGAEDPEQLAEKAKQRSLLEKALQSLAHDDREILVLRDVEGLSNNETAEALNLGLAAVKSRLHRARLRMAAALRKEGFDGTRS